VALMPSARLRLQLVCHNNTSRSLNNSPKCNDLKKNVSYETRGVTVQGPQSKFKFRRFKLYVSDWRC
jgi:hypothetical protein